jgi:VanZ family protein
LKRVVLWGPVLVVMGLIFFASSLSDPGAPPGNISDKAAHFLIYGALGAALVRALAGGRSAAMRPRQILFAVVLATLYGATDEIHQYFVPPRSPDVMDVAADAAGAMAGAIAIAAIARLLSPRFQPPASAGS